MLYLPKARARRRPAAVVLPCLQFLFFLYFFFLLYLCLASGTNYVLDSLLYSTMPLVTGLRYFRRKGTHLVQVFAALVFITSGTIVLGAWARVQWLPTLSSGEILFERNYIFRFILFKLFPPLASESESGTIGNAGQIKWLLWAAAMLYSKYYSKPEWAFG